MELMQLYIICMLGFVHILYSGQLDMSCEATKTTMCRCIHVGIIFMWRFRYCFLEQHG